MTGSTTDACAVRAPSAGFVPPDWETCRVSDLSATYAGGTPPRCATGMFGGNIPWVKSGELNRDEIDETEEGLSDRGFLCSAAKWVEPNTPVIALYGATAGVVSWLVVRATTNQAVLAVPPRDESTNRRWLFWALRSASHRMLAILQGSGQPNLSKAVVDATLLRRPPEPEQRRIAQILDAADEAIRKTEALVAKLRQMKVGLLHDLLTRGLDEHGHLRDPLAHPEQFKDSPVGKVPKDWDIVRVDAVGDVRLGRQRSPKHQSGRFTTSYLRVANVFDGWIDYSDVLAMDFTDTEKAVYGLRPGDILLNEGQSLELVGRCAIFEGRAGVLCFQNTLIRFRAASCSLPQFCRAVFKYWLDTGRFTTVARQTTSVAHLGADRFAGMLFPCPKPSEQKSIVAALESHEIRIRTEEACLDKLKRTKQGLMRDLLTGRVRVRSADK